jgi:adenylosuccinate synthase
MKKISIVLGLGFGDEGKGSLINTVCLNSDNPLVIRFSGGHQVGHTVVVGDKRHVFSNFGSGSLLDVPTYWSEYCTVDPIGVFNEQKALNTIGIAPRLYFNANAMVTTPFDKWQNITLDSKSGHGSVGVGFGTTIQRNEDHYHLYVRDLLYPNIRDIKLKLIQENYYKYNRIDLVELKKKLINLNLHVHILLILMKYLIISMKLEIIIIHMYLKEVKALC